MHSIYLLIKLLKMKFNPISICLIFATIFISTISLAQVGIGTNSPNASAKLDITSTTQGLLPPRMTIAQRDAIVSPIAGLMIFCTDNFGGEVEVFNGLNFVNLNGRFSLSIGDHYQGGKVAYILVSGDPGYNAIVQHGLIAATSDQSTGIQWYDGSSTTTGATGTDIGTGLSNTNTIITSQGNTGSYAAKLCADYSLNVNGVVYDDWYLPSQDELNKLYLNQVAIGGFANNYYWSSSEYDDTYARRQDFASGYQTTGYKIYSRYVRAIRAF